MKNIWLKKYFGIGCVAILLLGACSDGGGDKPDEPDPVTPEITIPSGVDLNPVIKAEGNDPVSLEFTTTAPWSVSITNTRAESWISVNPLSGQAGKNSITITAQPNSAYDERSATITLKSGNVTKNIVVTQKQRNALTFTSDKVELEAKGGTFTVEVKHNVQVTIESKSTWIKKSPASRALETTKYVFIADANDEVEIRRGEIVVSNGELKDTVRVYQQGTAPSIVLTTKKESVTAEGKDITVELVSNVNYKMKFYPACDWIKEIVSKALSTHTLRLRVDKNESFDVRKAQLIFYNESYSATDTLLVEQAQADGLNVQEKTFDLNAEGGQIKLNVESNIKYEIVISVDWIKQTKTRALVLDRLAFDVSPNTSTTTRTGTITVSGGGITRTVSVTQQAEKTVPDPDTTGDTEDFNQDNQDW